MQKINLAVVLTCHNRKAQTLACLSALYDQTDNREIEMDVYLVDAGSTDGTRAAISEQFPRVNLILRNDDLYWCGGMQAAWAEAMKGNYDYYLLLNDDTILLPGAIQTFLESARKACDVDGCAGIIVGSTRDPITGKHSYGGVTRDGKRGNVIPNNDLQACDQMSCNCTLVSREVVMSVGNFSVEFTHALADHDYSLRAKAKGFSVWVAPGYQGTCPANPIPRWANPRVPLIERLKFLHTPKGLPPMEWITFCRRHLPYQWPLRLMLLYLHAVFPRFWLNRKGQFKTV